MYLRKTADDAAVSEGVVLFAQAVIEETSVAEGHVVQTDVELSHDAVPQVITAAGELKQRTDVLLLRTFLGSSGRNMPGSSDNLQC